MPTNHMLRSKSAYPAGTRSRGSRSGQDFARLVRLMNEAPEETRDRLFGEIVSFFIDGAGKFTEREHSVVAHILATVSERVSNEARRQLALRLAALPNAPDALVVKLATAELETARALLLGPHSFSEAALLDILKRGEPQHRLLLVRRRSLPPSVIRTVAAAGDEALIEALLGNDQLDIHPTVFDILIERAEKMPAIYVPLLTRRDLPRLRMADLFFQVGGGERRFILSQCSDGKPAPVPAVDERALVRAMRDASSDEFATVFARAFGISETQAQQVLAEPSADALAVACRAASFGRASFSTLAILTDRTRLGDKDAQARLACFEDVDEEGARHLFALWTARDLYARDAGWGGGNSGFVPSEGRRATR